MADDNDFDEGFASDVRTALRARTTDLTPPPGLLPDLRKRYGRRVAVRRAGLVAAPLAVAAVIAAVVIAPAAPSGSSTQAQTGQEQTGQEQTGQEQTSARTTVETGQKVRTIAYVAEQVDKALADVGQYVVRSTQTTSVEGKQVVYRYWTTADHSTVRKESTIDGVVDHDSVVTRTGSTDVVHSNRTWYTGDGFGDAIVAAPFPTPAKIREDLAGGNLEVVGAEEVDGQTAIHLRRSAVATPPAKDPNKPPTAEIVYADLWVAESTYLPLRVDDNDFAWLPPTPENLALLTPPVPAGFTQVPAPGN